MCGICGQFGPAKYIDVPRLKQMTRAMKHRGPDQEAYYVSPTLAFGFRRLAIVDIKGGQQPLSNEDKRIRIIFNGEIYNYKELREHLISHGHSLQQAGDGEVLAHLYEEYGLDFPSKLRGTFAIALWDERLRRLLLVRDRLGVKPLYVRYNSESLAFASELGALLIGAEKPAINFQALDQYLSYRYVPAPNTIFRGIYKVPPGTTLLVTFKKGELQVRTKTFWLVPSVKKEISLKEASELVHTTLKEALQIRWPDEVPAAYYFSGGLDSSGLIAMHQSLYHERARTYAIGFERPHHTRDFRYYSELDQARNAARVLQTQHCERVVPFAEVQQRLGRILTAMDEPIADPTAIPLYFLSEFASSRGEKVVFSGEGADELFGGYSTYLEPSNFRRYHQLPGWTRNILEHTFPQKTERFSLSLSERYFGVGGLMRFSQKQSLYSGKMLSALAEEKSYFPTQHLLEDEILSEEERMLQFDMCSWLPENTLMKSDKMTMQHGLEIRLPYLDHELVELGMSFPLPYKVTPKESKVVLRRALAGFLPEEVVTLPKNGFPVPLTAWLMDELKPEVKNVLLDPGARLREFLLPQQIEKMLQADSSHSSRLIWALYVLEVYLTFWQQAQINVCTRPSAEKNRIPKLGGGSI
ncbi:asparagine synthase, glutamine-hydrolyzing [Desulfosporosinus acidiphilus SJ4]|uniref:asparagine synthase (glutamine-hydrolyzing) n=1 Tax=Desulfosporosinus acidiphilus (strain DSM 22704 / JCM 16185 / SJ4) TaxID=646529 RepID=I4DB63_DESAJ|nr:asparagine synthase (glutamine-hydrolyzing) [Desulfosporosinus acidiphilus]AFM43037.1 asparagine synthase, glutamine-hydrolyzing [Desulfosporosinus acidiphilus SJ4]